METTQMARSSPRPPKSRICSAARFTGLPEALRLAREAGNAIEKKLTIKLAEFGTPTPTEIRRLDVFSEEITDVLARECRTAMSTYHGPLKAIPSSGA
jgi:hypothetical protein